MKPQRRRGLFVQAAAVHWQVRGVGGCEWGRMSACNPTCDQPGWQGFRAVPWTHSPLFFYHQPVDTIEPHPPPCCQTCLRVFRSNRLVSNSQPTLCLSLSLSAGEKRSALSAQQRLWELLEPAGLAEDSGSSLWLRAYRQVLQEEGADEETQRKAVLMQLWATQVSHRSAGRGGGRGLSLWKAGVSVGNPRQKLRKLMEPDAVVRLSEVDCLHHVFVRPLKASGKGSTAKMLYRNTTTGCWIYKESSIGLVKHIWYHYYYDYYGDDV